MYQYLQFYIYKQHSRNLSSSKLYTSIYNSTWINNTAETPIYPKLYPVIYNSTSIHNTEEIYSVPSYILVSTILYLQTTQAAIRYWGFLPHIYVFSDTDSYTSHVQALSASKSYYNQHSDLNPRPLDQGINYTDTAKFKEYVTQILNPLKNL